MNTSDRPDTSYQTVCVCGGYGFPFGNASAARIIMVGKALREAGVGFRVLHCGPSPNPINDQRSGVYEGIPFQYTTSVKRPKNKVARLLVYARALIGLALQLAKVWPVRRSTLVYLYFMEGPLTFCVGALCQLLGLSLVQELCEWFPSLPSFSTFDRWLYRKRLFTAATGALVISKAIETRVTERCKQLKPDLIVHRVGVMVDVRRFAVAVPATQNPDRQMPTFVYCGTWLHDVLFLIRAVALVRLAGYDCKLTIIGECGEQSGPALLDYARDHGLSPEDIILAGCVYERALADAYKAATALLMPLHKDDPSVTRLPNKMGEYLASGRPVITCQIGDLTDFLIDNVNAYVGEPGNEQAFAGKMIEILEDPDRAERIGAAGQQACFAHLDYQAYRSDLARFFARCMAHHNECLHPKGLRSDELDLHACVPTVTSTNVQTVRVLGSRVHLVSVGRTLDHMEKWINARDGCCRRVTVSGFHGLLQADKNHKLHAVLNGAELWVPDGIAPVLIARLRGCRNVQRTTGTDIMLEFFRRANEKGYRSYFYGETDATLKALIERVERDYPGHKIAGAFAPPFRPLTPDEDKEIIDRINAARPDVLWVSLGTPKQNLWIHERLDRLKVPVAIGAGAAFAFVAGTVQRCPEWMGRIGFEWAYRIVKEPRKLWRRDLIEGSSFLFRLGLDATGLRRTGS